MKVKFNPEYHWLKTIPVNRRYCIEYTPRRATLIHNCPSINGIIGLCTVAEGYPFRPLDIISRCTFCKDRLLSEEVELISLFLSNYRFK